MASADPTVAVHPPGRSARQTERAANMIVAAPHRVNTMIRKAACGAVSAYMSLIEWATVL